MLRQKSAVNGKIFVLRKYDTYFSKGPENIHKDFYRLVYTLDL